MTTVFYEYMHFEYIYGLKSMLLMHYKKILDYSLAQTYKYLMILLISGCKF